MTFISQPSNSRVAIGIDVVTISRIQRLLDDYPTRTREFVFTKNEQRYCDKQAYPAQHYAARWAVKEAFFKSLNKSESDAQLTSVEIQRNPNPTLCLKRDGKRSLSEVAIEHECTLNKTNLDISMTHDNKSVAAGIVIIFFG